MGTIYRPALWEPSYEQGFARNAAEAWNTNLREGLLSCWHMALGPTGATLFDVSRYGRHGPLTSMDPATDWVVGERGYALVFDGNSEWVDLPATITSSPYTMAVWFNADVGAAGSLISVSDRSGTSGYVDIRVNNTFLRGRVNGAAQTNIEGVVAGTWQLAVLTEFSSTSRTLWLDGATDSNTESETITGFNGSAIGALKRSDLVVPFEGQVRSAAVWNRALSSNEIQQLYADPHAIVRPRMAVPFSVAAPAAGNPWYQYAQEQAVTA